MRRLPGTGRQTTWGLSRFSRSENGTLPFRSREVVLRLPLREPRVLATALVVLLCCLLAGCGKAESRVDPKPFESAIADYLEQNNMAMKVKEIKEGPTIDGETASLVASLTHAELGGPAVTWELKFEKNADGSWKAVSHEKR